MKFKELCQIISARESGKQQVNITQIREILSNLSEEMFLDSEVILCLVKNGKRRVQKDVKRVMHQNGI